MADYSATIRIRKAGEGVVVTTDTSDGVREDAVGRGQNLSFILRGDQGWTTKVQVAPMPSNSENFPTTCTVSVSAKYKRTSGCLWLFLLFALAVAFGILKALFGG